MPAPDSDVGSRYRAWTAQETLPQAVEVVAFAISPRPEVTPLGTLAARFTGTAHGLDAETLTSTLVLRALTTIHGRAAATSAAERRQLWVDAGVATDLVSGTVITWGLRPPGDDAWSQMMRARADLDLVAHLTARELRSAPTFTTGRVFGTENPQVLQAVADAGTAVLSFASPGNPRSPEPCCWAGWDLRCITTATSTGPAFEIAARIFAAGATPWRFSARDYLDAADQLAAPLPLGGTEQPTPWDRDLNPAMLRRGVAVHEEAVVDVLLADLRARR